MHAFMKVPDKFKESLSLYNSMELLSHSLPQPNVSATISQLIICWLQWMTCQWYQSQTIEWVTLKHNIFFWSWECFVQLHILEWILKSGFKLKIISSKETLQTALRVLIKICPNFLLALQYLDICSDSLYVNRKS